MHPITEADVVVCPHGGKVVLKATDPNWQHKGVPVLAITDLDGAKITGCQYKIYNGTSWIPKPCLTTVTGAPTAATKAHRKNIPISLVEKISSVVTDNGFSVALQGNPYAQGMWNII